MTQKKKKKTKGLQACPKMAKTPLTHYLNFRER